MQSDSLFSQAWCELVFEGRNKQYGAYRLRQRAGHRYAFVLAVIVAIGVAIVASLVGWQWAKSKLMEEGEINLEVLADLASPTQEGHELHAVAAGRRRTAVAKLPPKAASTTPTISNQVSHSDVLTLGTPSIVKHLHDALIFAGAAADEDPPEDLGQDLVNPTLVVTDKVTILPDFPGGLQALMKWLDERVVYPSAWRAKKTMGVVLVAFVVDTDGQVKEARIEQSSGDRMLDASALGAVKTLPQWRPGRNAAGQAVPVAVTLPVHFMPEP
ncbi:MAG: energy transducer TonB [Bacteroidales bacterium]|nr:energy transducer TonB [Bacteroidales bacterium]